MTHVRKNRRMYHDRRDGKNYLSCLVHGPQRGPISQDEAERGHAEGEKCPVCREEANAAFVEWTMKQLDLASTR